MKHFVSLLSPTPPYWQLVIRATLALSLGVALPSWAALNVNASNGTVADSSTSLIWDQCPFGLSGSTCATGTAFSSSWANALVAAASANTANYKGFNDWRVPNKNELESLVKIDSQNPAIDSAAFPGTPTDNYFWSSTNYALDPISAWYVDFNPGDTNVSFKTDAYYVRLVRSGQSFASFDPLASAKSYTSNTATSSGSETATFTGGAAGCGYTSSQFQAAPASPPAGVTMPHGVFAFTTNDCGTGNTLNFTLTFPQPLPAGAQYYKYGSEPGNATPHWYVFPAIISGNQITFSITDNGAGDSDPRVGFIADPGGPGVPVDGGGGGGAGGGVTSVPTLNEWGLMLLVGLMGLIGTRRAARRR